MRIPPFLRDQGKLLSLIVGAAILVTAYFTGIPGLNDNIDPVFHLLHNLYSAMWSNMWAPSIWTLLGFVISDIRHARRTEHVKSHVAKMIGDSNAE